MADLTEVLVDAVEIDHPESGDLAIVFAVSPFPDDMIAVPPGYTLSACRTVEGQTLAAAWKVIDDYIPERTVLVSWARSGVRRGGLRFFRSRVVAA